MPENGYLWVMALRSDRTPQLLHLSWMLIAIGLVWKWAQLWHDRVAWLSIAIIISIPSLPLVSSWAYTDFALTCMTVACLYALFRFSIFRNTSWLMLCGVFAGLAMGVKYTSFLLPITVNLMILWWGQKNLRSAIAQVMIFSLVALLIAAPWYVRNWYLMHNPFYPFIFGGRYWDSVRAALYGMNESGIGWDVKELLLLPLTATRGYRDANFFDGGDDEKQCGWIEARYRNPTACTLWCEKTIGKCRVLVNQKITNRWIWIEQSGSLLSKGEEQ